MLIFYDLILKRQRLRWFGHVQRSGDSLMGEVFKIEIKGRRSPGQLKKNWKKVMEEGMKRLEENEEVIGDRIRRRCIIVCPTPQKMLVVVRRRVAQDPTRRNLFFKNSFSTFSSSFFGQTSQPFMMVTIAEMPGLVPAAAPG